MDLSLSRNPPPLCLSKTSYTRSRYLLSVPLSNFPNLNLKPRIFSRKQLHWRHNHPIRAQNSNHTIDDGFELEDVPHLTNFLPDLPVILFFNLMFFHIYIYSKSTVQCNA
ncbi:hypothetical protein CsSME_00001331 [Camellia sinensis var. sinensis]